MKHFILFFLTFFIATTNVEAQRRTTNVRGYTRKDGTYVRPHIRTYNAGSSSYSSSTYSSSISNKNSDEDIPLSTLTIGTLEKGDYQTSTSKYGSGNKHQIQETSLTAEAPPTNDTIKLADNAGQVIYVSVLRYNGQTIDICPIPRNILGDWDFTEVYHRFPKTAISTDDALDLVSNYSWRISSNEVSKGFKYSFDEKGFPKYLTRSVEAIKLK